MTPKQRFGIELRRWRTERGLSQANLGKLVHRHKSVISRIEAGTRPVDLAFVKDCERVLRADGALLAVMPPQEAPPPNSAISLRDLGLPPAPVLVGRDEHISEIRRLLTPASVATSSMAAVCVLHGMAGIGKTASALVAAHEMIDLFPDGCVYRDLGGDTAGLRPEKPDDLLAWLLRYLGVEPSSLPAPLADRAALFRGLTRNQRILLIFDNVGGVSQIRAAIPAAARCAVLITTRQRLPSLEGARHLELPLLTDSAAHLLLDRLVPAEARTEQHRTEAIEIVRRCGNLPLALHVAAGMFRRRTDLGLEGVRKRLDSGPLSDGERDVSLVLRASLPESGSLQHRLFVLIALFPGQDLTVRIAAALAGTDEAQARDLLDHLWDRHLLMPGAGSGYRVHDLLRQLAIDELGAIAPAERDAALRRLLAQFLADADSADRIIAPHRNRHPLPPGSPPGAVFGGSQGALSWLHAVEPTLLALAEAAADHGLDETCWHLAHVLRGYFFLTCRLASWTAIHDIALRAALRAGDRWWEATTRGNLGLAHALAGRLEQAETQYRQARAIFLELDDEVSAAHNLGHLAWIAHLRGDHPGAVDRASAALGVYRRAELPRNAAIMQREIGTSLTALGQFAEAGSHFDAAIVGFRALRLDQDLAMALNDLAVLRLRTGGTAEAATLFTEAADLSERCGARGVGAHALRGLGDTLMSAGDHRAARACWTEALTRIEELALPGAEELHARLRGSRTTQLTAPVRR